MELPQGAWADRLRESLASGIVLNVAPELNDAEVTSDDPKWWSDSRCLPADVIRGVLLTPGVAVDPHGMQIRGALITGSLDLRYATLSCRLVFDRCRFEKAPDFEQSVMPGLNLEGCCFPGLSISAAHINGELEMPDVQCEGEVEAFGIEVTGELSLRGARLINEGGSALSLDGAIVGGGLCVDKGFNAIGGVRALGMHVTGEFSLTEATVLNPGGIAMHLDRVSISGGALVGRGFTAIGEVRFLGMQVSGQLSLKDVTLKNRGGTALNLDGVSVGQDAYLDDGFSAAGEVRALGMQLAGQLSLRGALLKNPNRVALCLDRVNVGGDVFLDKGFSAAGEVRALGIRVVGQLSFANATVTNPERNALSLDGAIIDGDALLTDGFRAIGEVRAPGSKVTGQLSIRGARLANPDGNALNLNAAVVNGLLINEYSTFEGTVDLAFASFRVLSVGDVQSTRELPPLSAAQGWEIGAVHGFLQGDRKSASAWLNTIPGSTSNAGKKEFKAQPWHQLAGTYERTGRPEDGRWLRYQAARKATRIVPWKSKTWRWLYDGAVGYGYYPARVLVWMVLLWGLVFAISCANAGVFTPTSYAEATRTITAPDGQSKVIEITGASKTPHNYPAFQPALYSLDVALPAATTGQTAAWQITKATWLPIPLIFAGVKGLSWVLTALLLAGVTGLLRKT